MAKITSDYTVLYREPSSLNCGSFSVRLNRLPSAADMRKVLKFCDERNVVFLGLTLSGFEYEIIPLLSNKTNQSVIY